MNAPVFGFVPDRDAAEARAALHARAAAPAAFVAAVSRAMRDEGWTGAANDFGTIATLCTELVGEHAAHVVPLKAPEIARIATSHLRDRGYLILANDRALLAAIVAEADVLFKAIWQ